MYYKKQHTKINWGKKGRAKRARVTRGSRNARHGKGKHFNVHKPSARNTRKLKKLPRNAENAIRGGDTRRRFTPPVRTHGDACGSWGG
jgi:hypothetical protein